MLSMEEQNKLREEEEKRQREAEEQERLIQAMMKQKAQQSSGSGGGVNPLQAYSMYSKFAGGGGGGGSGALAAAGPWLGVAALGIANEYGQRKAGNRAEDTDEYIGDLLTGKVIEQDVTRLAGGDKDDFAVVGTEFLHPIRGPKNFFKDPERYLKFWEHF